ncbi:MAG: hypothetical protein ACKOOD_00110 [Microbacteriaceae bacterium]
MLKSSVGKLLVASVTSIFVVGSFQISTAIEPRDELKIGNSSDVLVPDDLKWSTEAISAAEELIQDLRKPADALLVSLRDDGVSSLQITRSSANLVPEEIVGQYPAFDAYNHKVSVAGLRDWGDAAKTRTFQPSDDINVANYLVSFEPGLCRLSFALFNWNTWFSPDCKVSVATAQTYLQMSLVSWMDNSPSASTSAYFGYLYALKDIVTNHIDYSVVDGRMYSEALEAIMEPQGILLERPTDSDAVGYKITLDPQDKWSITFTMNSPDLQMLADQVSLVENEGEKYLYFGSR